jgi:hypothetical protein
MSYVLLVLIWMRCGLLGVNMDNVLRMYYTLVAFCELDFFLNYEI